MLEALGRTQFKSYRPIRCFKFIMMATLGRKETNVQQCVDDDTENAGQQLVVINNIKIKTNKVEGLKRRVITVEPIILGTTLCHTISAAVTVDLILRQCCHSYGVSMAQCTANSTIEDESQKSVANIQAAIMIISFMLPVFLCLIIGPWSDTNGRKPFLNLALFGQLTTWMMYAALASIENLNPMVLTAPSLLTMITGGHPAVSMLTYSYLSNVTTENKAFRMGLAMTGAVIANCIGPLIGNWIYNGGTYYGYISVYGACCLLQFLVFLYAIFGLPETVKVDKKKRKRLFTVTHLLGTFNFFRRKRPIRQIILIRLTILVICVCSVLFASEFEVYFLSLKKKLQWDVDKFSKFTSIYKGINCLYMTLGIWFMSSFLKIPDSYTLFISFVAASVGMISFAISNSSTSVYVANVIGAAGRMAQPICLSLLTKAVNSDETGSAMTIATAFESIAAPLCSLLYARIYGLVVSRDPFEVYYLPAATAVIGAITAMAINYFQRKREPSIN